MFPRTSAIPHSTLKETRFQADITLASPMWRSRGREVRGFLCLLICASILSCLAGLPIIPSSAVLFKFYSFIQKVPSSWSRSCLWTYTTCPALRSTPAFCYMILVCYKMKVALVPLQMSPCHSHLQSCEPVTLTETGGRCCRDKQNQ